jgi:hypothetical protein
MMGMFDSNARGAGYTPDGNAFGTVDAAKNQKQNQQMKAMELMMKSMAVKKGQQEMEVAEEQHKIDMTRARNMVQNVGKLTEQDMLVLDNNIGKLKTEMNGRQLQDTATVVSAMMEAGDDEVYQKGLEQLKKKGINTEELGLGKGYRQDLPMMKYILGQATTDQQSRQKEKLMNVDAKNNMDAIQMQGDIRSDLQTKQDKAAMERLQLQLKADLMKAGMKSPALASLPKGLQPTFQELSADITGRLRGVMESMGGPTMEEYLDAEGDPEIKQELATMTSDILEYMATEARVFMEDNPQAKPDMDYLRKKAERLVFDRVGTDGRYYPEGSRVLEKQKKIWMGQAAVALSKSADWTEDQRQTWIEMPLEEKTTRLEQYWTNPQMRGSSDKSRLDARQPTGQMSRNN